jgi:signal peptidase I
MFAIVRVEGSSMLPTYADGDRLLAVRRPFGRRIRTGDVVVVRAPAPATQPGSASAAATEILVKRVRASAGERLPDGQAGAVVPLGSYFVQGDNGLTYDSRRFGVVTADAIMARVLRRLGPGVETGT